jgi:chemotaxis protein MotB
MTRASRFTVWTLLTALPFAGIGCVPQDRYDQLLMANRSLEEQLLQMESDRDSARADLNATRDQMSRRSTNLEDLQSQNRRLSNDLERMASEYDALLRRVSELEVGPLPADVEDAIQRLANAHPDVLSFDASRGLLRFASDFTFDLGSVALRSEASETLRKLAEILNTSAAREFEARIVGHTDNVRISRAETLRNHPTNVHLSVHRAISVRDALVEAGITPVRMQVAGYGEHRPVVANRTGGTAENRRVEIFLVPMPTDIQPVESAPASNTSAPAASSPASQRRSAPEPMK